MLNINDLKIILTLQGLSFCKAYLIFLKLTFLEETLVLKDDYILGNTLKNNIKSTLTFVVAQISIAV